MIFFCSAFLLVTIADCLILHYYVLVSNYTSWQCMDGEREKMSGNVGIDDVFIAKSANI